MKYLLRLTVAILLAASAQFSGAQVLWQNYTLGMTLDEVRRALPSAELLPDDSKHKLGTGGMLKLRAPGVEIMGTDFSANFFFVDDKLTDVQLAHDSKQNVAAGKHLYDELVTALRSKYGNELQRETSPGLGWSAHTTWASGGTTIVLLAYLYDAPPSNFIQVSYSARLAKEAGKL